MGLDEYIPKQEQFLEYALKEFNHFENFPTTREMGAFARKLSGLDHSNLPDDLLIGWLNAETLLFQVMENHQVENKIKEGFRTTDEFLSYSNSVLNRRKSRRVYSLENHLEALFEIHALSFDRKISYENPKFTIEYMFILSTKSTCKDRWRQVLNEADRIKEKHLCTLEAAISENQTDEMKASNLCLVVPTNILHTYTDKQKKEILNVEQFIDIVKHSQGS